MIAAAEELGEELLEFGALIKEVNDALKPRGIRLVRENWTPGDTDEFARRVDGCQMCLCLYWRELPSSADDDVRDAYEATCAGRNPQHLYIFFKEPSDEISEALSGFKAGFENKYGHFFCRFENVDTLKLQFLLQFEKSQSTEGRDFVKVSGGKVMVEDRALVDLDNVPFAGLNKEYQRLQKLVAELQSQLADIRARYKSNPDSDDLFVQLTDVSAELKLAREEYDRYQDFLLDKAMEFARGANRQVTERMRQARELFERGEAGEAARLMDVENLKRDKERNRIQYQLHLERRRLEIEEFRSSATYAMADPDKSIPERFAAACSAYDEAVDTAREIRYDDEKMAELLFDYAYLLTDFNHMKDAVDLYTEALEIRRRLAAASPEAYEPAVADTLNNLAASQRKLQHYAEAEGNCTEALEIRRRLAAVSPEAYEPDVATTLNNLALLQSDLQHYTEAEGNYTEALEICRRLAAASLEAYEPAVATTLNNLAALQSDLRRYAEAEANYTEALEIYRCLAAANPEAYEPAVATTLNNLAALQYNLQRYAEAEGNYTEALEIRRRLAAASPEAYEPDVAMTLNNLASLQSDLHRYAEAEGNYTEALEIRRRIAAASPEAYEPDVATTLNNLAILQDNLRRYAEAEANYTEALEISRRLAAASPEAYEPDVAETLWNLALLFGITGPSEKERVCWNEALDIYRRLEQRNPGLYINYIKTIEEVLQ